MSVELTDLSKRYNCNGSNQDFPITFDYLDTAALVDVQLYSTSLGTYTSLVLNTHYTIASDTVTTVATYATGYDILMKLDFTDLITQGTDWVENDKFTSDSWETAVDRLTLICQWLAEGLSRCVQGPFGDDSGITWTLGETAPDRLNGYLHFNATTGNIEIVTSVTPSTATVSAFAETLLDDTSGPAMLSTLGVSTLILPFLSDTTSASARAAISAVASTDSVTGIIEGVASKVIKRKKFEISLWDMDTDATVDIYTYIQSSLICAVDAYIRSDVANEFHKLCKSAMTATGSAATVFAGEVRGWSTASDGVVNLSRGTGGYFDSSDFNSTAFSRGWIVVDYLG